LLSQPKWLRLKATKAPVRCHNRRELIDSAGRATPPHSVVSQSLWPMCIMTGNERIIVE
jgi:hypothetical protein